MTFEEYLVEKKIDSAQFKSSEGERWQEWASLFEQAGPLSFTAQKLYLINPTRRKYRLGVPSIQSSAPAPAAKSLFKPKISS